MLVNQHFRETGTNEFRIYEMSPYTAHFDAAYGTKKVPYDRLPRRQLKASDGFIHLNGKSKPLSTDSICQRAALDPAACFASSTWIYVMLQNGWIFVTPSRTNIKHSSMLPRVAAAGQIIIRKGVIEYIDNHSGHFEPDALSLGQVLYQLEKDGVDISQIRVHDYHTGPPSK